MFILTVVCDYHPKERCNHQLMSGFISKSQDLCLDKLRIEDNFIVSYLYADKVYSSAPEVDTHIGDLTLLPLNFVLDVKPLAHS